MPENDWMKNDHKFTAPLDVAYDATTSRLLRVFILILYLRKMDGLENFSGELEVFFRFKATSFELVRWSSNSWFTQPERIRPAAKCPEEDRISTHNWFCSVYPICYMLGRPHNQYLDFLWDVITIHTATVHMCDCRWSSLNTANHVPSGKRLYNYGKSPFLIGKPSISMGHLYHGYVSHNQRLHPLMLAKKTVVSSVVSSTSVALKNCQVTTGEIHMGLSENSVSLNTMVNDHYPYYINGYNWGYTPFSDISICLFWTCWCITLW